MGEREKGEGGPGTGRSAAEERCTCWRWGTLGLHEVVTYFPGAKRSLHGVIKLSFIPVQRASLRHMQALNTHLRLFGKLSCSPVKVNWSASTRGAVEVCASHRVSSAKSEHGLKLLQWDFLFLLLWENVTWLWHLFHWYLQSRSGSWFNFHNRSWNPVKLQQPGPRCLLCCPAALQSSLCPNCWWAPCAIPAAPLLGPGKMSLKSQLFTSIPAIGIFPGCRKGFLESFCTAAVL